MHATPSSDNANVSSQNFRLKHHPAFTRPDRLDIQVSIQRLPLQARPGLELQFELRGAADTLRMPPWTDNQSADGLWRHTCAELFIRTAGNPAYQEFNFSPSGRWAAYRFSAERERDTQAETRHPALPPTIQTVTTAERISITVRLPLPNLPLADNAGELLLGLSLVTESQGGDLTYWALHHPRADCPDFHHPAACVLPLRLHPLPFPSIENLP